MMRVYVIYDKVAEEGGPLFLAKNDGVAMRQYMNLIKDVKQPGDFQLYVLGEYDPSKINVVVYEDAREVNIASEIEG